MFVVAVAGLGRRAHEPPQAGRDLAARRKSRIKLARAQLSSGPTPVGRARLLARVRRPHSRRRRRHGASSRNSRERTGCPCACVRLSRPRAGFSPLAPSNVLAKLAKEPASLASEPERRRTSLSARGLCRQVAQPPSWAQADDGANLVPVYLTRAPLRIEMGGLTAPDEGARNGADLRASERANERTNE